ncbi:MAG TPA: DUF4115 domain-containing protein [Thermodesulfobacteriota bacterium]|nr:DUF4115 domain-containing protein [Deltaproteobacteria bacterium]HNR13227.1 DUF4115 domain-containing protein [Thermodesulfobacteriota bacterium]HNU70872.1 DUF4115 domain-containing protein [Thermodesulfobacteriota bacterium]HOC37867.1 DUF4115 domain-containing protein [Thermodesulfobacteriota bacterium]
MSTLGEFLRQQRVSKNISLDAAEEATKINRKVLEAIERNHYDPTLSSVYIRGFIRAYSRFLEVDEKKALALYDQTGHNADEHREEPAPSAKRHNLPLLLFLVILILVLVILAIYFVTSGNLPLLSKNSILVPPSIPEEKLPESALTPNGPAPKESTPIELASVELVPPVLPALEAPGEDLTTREGPAGTEILPQDEALTGQQTAPEPADPEKLIEQPQPVPPPATPFALVVEGKARTWMEVSIDDSKPFQVMLFSGNSITWKATEKISLRVGNAGGVILKENGTELKPLGKSGEVVNVLLTAHSLSLNQGTPQGLELWQAQQPE